MGEMWRGQTELPWKAILLTASIVALFVGWVAALWPYYHVLGTDQTGNDVLYQAIKSIRTAVMMVVAISSGRQFRWYTAPRSLMMSSDSGMGCIGDR